jgi:hypothetical protein
MMSSPFSHLREYFSGSFGQIVGVAHRFRFRWREPGDEVWTTAGWGAARTLEPGLAAGLEYEWQVQVQHPGAGTESEWSEAAWFTVNDQVPASMVVNSEDSEDAERNLPLRNGWNLLSLTVEPTPVHPQHLFGMGTTIWAWDPARQVYDDASAVSPQPGYGYWVNIPAAAELPAQIDGFSPRFTLVPLTELWNLIGPFVDDIAVASERVKLPMYRYAVGEYEQTERLRVGYGHWLFSTAEQELDLAPTPTEPIGDAR